MIYQMHPDHGKHIAFNALEAKENRDNGWEDVTKEQFYAVPKEKQEKLDEMAKEAPKKKKAKKVAGKKKSTGKKDPLKDND